MSESLLVLFPGTPGEALPWSLWRNGALTGEGVGSDVADAVAALEPPPKVAAIVPAADAPLYRIELPDLAPAQARAAAMLIAAENAAAPADTLHVALGPKAEDGARMAAVVASARMIEWIAICRARGFDPRHIVPASALLPAPDDGFLAAEIAGEKLLRGRECAMVDDAATRLIVGDANVEPVAVPPLDRAIEMAAVDLAQGPFAPRRRMTIDWKRLRRVGLFAGAAAVLWVGAGLVDLVKLNAATNALEVRAVAVATPLLPGETIREPLAQLRAANVARGDGSAELLAMLAATQRALADIPDAALTGIGWTGDGALTASVRAPSPEALAQVVNALRAQGFVVPDAAPQSAVDGQRAELRISR
jgi:general secretion pathway protein L